MVALEVVETGLGVEVAFHLFTQLFQLENTGFSVDMVAEFGRLVVIRPGLLGEGVTTRVTRLEVAFGVVGLEFTLAVVGLTRAEVARVTGLGVTRGGLVARLTWVEGRLA